MEITEIWELVNYIKEKYSDANKIVEIGIGFNPRISYLLKEELPKTEIIAVDKNLKSLEYVSRKCPRIKVKQDDIFTPDLDIYRHASLILSCNPPDELIEELCKISEIVKADLLIRPLIDEGSYMFRQQDNWIGIRKSKYLFFLKPCKKRGME